MYILITPAKNEAENLPDLIKSILKQTVKPNLWVIVDDGSIDDTPKILANTKFYGWIKIIRLPPHPRDITFHYSFVCKNGFDYAIDLCTQKQIEYEFIGLIDADTLLEDKYFEKLINEFRNDPDIGIASGSIYYNNDGKLKLDSVNKKYPRGTGRLWRKRCFIETMGYLVEPSPDSISNVKALQRGWKVKQFKNIVAIQKRMTSSADGLWRGYKSNGFIAYYLNKHPLLVVLNAIYYSTMNPYYVGIPYLYGYILSIVQKKSQIRDKEIKDFYWNTRLKELILTSAVK